MSDAFPAAGSHLQRYAARMRCVEIDTSFYRPHQADTYARWAASTPADFRFSVKLPRQITHEGRLRRAREPLQQFLAQVQELGPKLGVLLVQLPPSFAYEARPVRRFFSLLTELHGGPVACEPRHASWFTPTADRALASLRVTRVAADPARPAPAAQPGGWLGPHGDGRGALRYHRWHGSPKVYWSRYEEGWLAAQAAAMGDWPEDSEAWIIFDNTAAGAALENALAFEAMLAAAARA